MMPPCRYLSSKVPVTRLVTFNEATVILGLSISTLNRQLKCGLLPPPVIIDDMVKGWRFDDFEGYLKTL
ncbi:hypothetical protein C9J41_17810 [Photobacterium sp. GB-50]|nr:hypothetical protein C9J41_17810 [Photobacterium sp. GB-50]